MALDTAHIRQQFSTLQQQIEGKPLVYLDSAATALMPEAVWEAMRLFETQSRSNVHRGMHVLAERATDAYETARKTVQQFLNAAHAQEIIFTKNSTESVNLVAHAISKAIHPGDTVLVTELEHHSNIVPWQQICEEQRGSIEWIPCDDTGTLSMERFISLLKSRNVKLLAISGQSNVLGVQPDLQTIIAKAHDAGARVLVDAAQLAAHDVIDVQQLDCDFLTFSGHKLYGPTGIGVLYGKRELLEAVPPFMGGGSMIRTVEKSGFTPADIPQKFEAGTPPIAQAIGLAAAINWLQTYSWDDVKNHEKELLAYARTKLSEIEGLRMLSPENAVGCISFVVDGVHPHDLTDVIGKQGICLRAGHHCTQPLHARLGVPASARLSVGIYNTTEDIDRCADAIKEAVALLKK